MLLFPLSGVAVLLPSFPQKMSAGVWEVLEEEMLPNVQKGAIWDARDPRRGAALQTQVCHQVALLPVSHSGTREPSSPSRFIKITLEKDLCMDLEFKPAGEATARGNASRYWENSAAQKTSTCGANSLKKRWVLSCVDHTFIDGSRSLISFCSLVFLLHFCHLGGKVFFYIYNKRQQHTFQDISDLSGTRWPLAHTYKHTGCMCRSVNGLISQAWAGCLEIWLMLSFHSLFFGPLSRL